MNGTVQGKKLALIAMLCGAIASGAAAQQPTLEQVMAVTIDQARAAVSDRTNMYFDAGHGTQVEYTSAGGKAYLWYPGNRIILPGEWKVEQQEHPVSGTPRKFTMVCFRYTENSYNPVTGSSGANWECGLAYSYVNKVRRVESVGGDVLGLAQMGAPPFPLSKDKTTLADLAARLARSK